MGVRFIKNSAESTEIRPIVEARNIGMSFLEAGVGRRRVLQDVSLTVPTGEVVCILGPSGCGKSTFLRILIGLATPTEGQVLTSGRSLVGILPGASLVFQSFALYPWLTVEDNVGMGLYRMNLPATEAHAAIEAAIDKVGLGGFERAFPKELSGGMKQRVGLARALVSKPALLCLDEPFSALDVMTAEALRSEVYRLWSEGKSGLQSVLLITHQIEEAVFLSDRIVIFDSNPGRIRAIVPNTLKHPREYRSKEFQDFVYHIHAVLTAVHLPDTPKEQVVPHAANGESPLLPIPNAPINQITGMVEILHDHGDSMNLFELQEFTETELGVTLPTVKGAEMLELIETPGDQVSLTTLGKRFVSAGIDERLDILRERITGMGLFRLIVRRLEATQDGSLPGDDVVQALAEHFPREPAKELAETVMNWGRVVELLDWDAQRDLWLLKGGARDQSG